MRVRGLERHVTADDGPGVAALVRQLRRRPFPVTRTSCQTRPDGDAGRRRCTGKHARIPGTRRCPEIVRSPQQPPARRRRRGARSPSRCRSPRRQAAQAAPSAQARLASAAKKSPNRKRHRDRPVQGDGHERQARAIVRAHQGRSPTGCRPSSGFAVKLPAKQASALRSAKGVLNVTLNTKVRNTTGGRRRDWLGDQLPEDRRRRPGCRPRASPARASASPSSTPASTATMPDFKNADGTSRVTNVIANPGATRPGDEVGHGTHVAGIIAGNSLNRARATEARRLRRASRPRPTWSRSRPPTTPATRPSWTSSTRSSSSSTTRTS